RNRQTLAMSVWRYLSMTPVRSIHRDDDLDARSLQACGESPRRRGVRYERIDVGERTHALELDLLVLRAVDEQDRPVRSLRHRTLDRAAARIRVGHAFRRHPAGADECPVRLEPAEVIHRVGAVRSLLSRDIVARAQERPAVRIRA